ncbi:glucose-1-phosphate adenylyltransferase [Oceanobacillus profundus]|uniref:Glucose-1-phosphate adenylyltransferase n=1 Tax=Oceanobacillus profundus TaxID=372463 RepID=A0A417YI85_9BACI|nr:glucose-1-phosphate adenylyltransferase [Oceanobacillus profundus]MCM3400120.1 glucose-1-phosphate adenylyltransferase [Oceanobacillus profundus]PAE28288.1 glucose-1-phosphate adenylyltransferase [Paenibacillus sp. 7884-2]RHW32680.1 glucose-1-phosphate adenylyltransferase [Oceanobacillus profundus]
MKECVGMLLAGGEGKRLGELTHHLAKPAVPFGGKYRIIDFTLSNCTNSGISTLGVLTQYSPLELNKHIGNGKPWDMDKQSGVTVLSPYTAKTGGDWYSGTADAIYQNMHFINQFNPEYVLVISGDHIYQMDYQKMLEQHKETNADATISVIEVPWDDASRFGILNASDNLRIFEFEEKPKNPQSNLASMGIYIFTWNKLKAYLLEDAQNKASSHDFGKDIIPAMLDDTQRLFAYRFHGYWKDVGTIQSYWEANMDLLDENLGLISNHKAWRIYTHDSNLPPQYISQTATVNNSLINSGCFIHGTIENSILFENVRVEQTSTVRQSIIHPGVRIGENCRLNRVIIMENTVIPAGTTIEIDEFQEPFVINQETLGGMLTPAGGESK